MAWKKIDEARPCKDQVKLMFEVGLLGCTYGDGNPDEVGRRQVSEEANHEDEKEKHFLSWTRMMEALILVP